MSVYYNEIDSFAAAWLRELIKAGVLPGGEVDERDMRDIKPGDLDGFTQCHFFAGIGGWAYALRLAGWPDDAPVWTGSCPCQPFSQAGRGGGVDDERHLWPDWRWLIDQRRPPIVFGEQVASKLGRSWLAGVQADLEALAYRGAAADLCAAGVYAPHIRQRLWWVAEGGLAEPQSVEHDGRRNARRGRGEPSDSGGLGNAVCARLEGHAGDGDGRREPGRECTETGRSASAAGAVSGLGDSDDAGSQQGRQATAPVGQRGTSVTAGGAGGLADAELPELPERRAQHIARSRMEGQHALQREGQEDSDGYTGGSAAGFWSDFNLIHCTDGKARRIEPGSFPLAHGVPARVGRLRGYGNAIVPQVAAVFVKSYLECRF